MASTKTSDERYHHGDLRAALVAEGLKMLKSGEAEALSLREIARNVGVSATAVYRHFPDKAALLDALCEVGDQKLAEAFRKAMAKEKPGPDAFGAMGRAYVRFALANPALFRLMMSAQGGKAQQSTSAGRSMLVRAIEELSGPKASKRQLQITQLRAWSVVHGMAMLMLDGIVPQDDALIDGVLGLELPE
jgi:AcrR family transcriptional regulator